MAKFYARLVLMVTTLIVGSILLVVYVSQSISELRVPPDLHNMHLIDDKGISARGELSSVSLVESLRLGHFTLATDDKDTVQHFSWAETQLAKEFCAKINYTAIPLAQMSVVICFHGKETLSNLLHTIHGVYQRTPARLLHEIILVDDYSQNADFGEILELYKSAIFGDKVRIIRNTERLGLIRARLRGIHAATAEVVAVMDSHVEVQPGWAEPLLHEIYINPKTLAASYIDWMERKEGRWEYRHGGTTWKTYFDWTFVFGWQTMAEAEIKARKNLIEPINAPVVIGTIYAIRKDHFFHVGAFDEGMQLWGGENLDLPVRVWLCGGRVVNVPCSRAGHMESSGGRDYRLSQEWEISKNTNYKRFAEAWAGEYKKQFYYYTPEAAHVNQGDLSSRLKYRSVCTRDFSWYLKEVFPELGIPERDGLAWGQLLNAGSKQCLDTRNTLVPGQGPCGQGGGGRQGVFWSKSLHLRFPIHILNYKEQRAMGMTDPELYMDEYISHYNTDRGSRYLHIQDGPIVEMQANKCLDGSIPDVLQFLPCDTKSEFQKWHFEHYTNAYGALLRKNSTEDAVKKSSVIYFKFLEGFLGKGVTLRQMRPVQTPG